MIRITREATGPILSAAYRIFIDGTYCGKIKRGETQVFEVETGNHTVWAKIDWRRSNKLSIDVNDSVVELEVGENESVSHPAAPDYNLLCSILFWNKYLWLRKKGGADVPPEDI